MRHRVKKNGTSRVYECEKTTQDPSQPAPSHQPTSSPHGQTLPVAAHVPPSHCHPRHHFPDPKHLSDLKYYNSYCKLSIQQLLQSSIHKQNSKTSSHPLLNTSGRLFQQSCLTSTTSKTLHDGLNHVTKSFSKTVAKEQLFISNSYAIFWVDSKGMVHIITTGRRELSKVSFCCC